MELDLLFNKRKQWLQQKQFKWQWVSSFVAPEILPRGCFTNQACLDDLFEVDLHLM